MLNRRTVTTALCALRLVLFSLAAAVSAAAHSAGEGPLEQAALDRLRQIDARIQGNYPLPIDAQRVADNVLAAVEMRLQDSGKPTRTCLRAELSEPAVSPPLLIRLNTIYACVQLALPDDTERAAMVSSITDAYLATLKGKNRLIDTNTIPTKVPVDDPDFEYERRGDALVVRLHAIPVNAKTRFRDLFVSEKDVAVVVLDLRGNEGGSFDAMIGLADSLISEGTLLIIKHKSVTKGTTALTGLKYPASESDMPFAGAVVVIVDRKTSSGAEMLAAALQDNGRATIIGERSAGIGLIRTLYPLNREVVLALVSEVAYRPNGNLIEGAGITPDCEVATDGAAVVDVALGIAHSGLGSCPAGPESDKGAPELQ